MYETDIYFLIYKYLESKDDIFQSTIEHLKADLNEKVDLGTVFDWKGDTRRMKIEDINRKFSNFSGNQLEGILIDHLKLQGNQINPLSLLQPPNLLSEPKTKLKVKNVKKLLRDSQFLNCQMSNKISCLKLKKLQLLKHGNIHKEETWNSSASNGTQAGNILRQIGQRNEVNNIDSEIEALKIQRDFEMSEAEKLMQDLSSNNSLQYANIIGDSYGIVNWIQKRNMGFCDFAKASSPLSTFLCPSINSTATRFQCQFKHRYTVSGHLLNPAYCVVFDRTGEYIITGADDFLVKIWHLKTGLLVHTLKGHQEYISLIDVSPDNCLVASACTAGIIRIWGLKNGKCIVVLKHGGPINWIKFHNSTFSLSSVGDDGNCIVWDLLKIFSDRNLVDEEDIETLPMYQIMSQKFKSDSEEDISHFSWSREVEDLESIVDTVQRSSLVLPHYQEIQQSLENDNVIKVTCLDISPCDCIVITGCDDAMARVWRFGDGFDGDMSTNTRSYASSRNTDDLSRSFESTRQSLRPEEIKRREIVCKHLVQRLEGHVSSITDVRFSNLGDRVVTGSAKDGTVRIWAFNSSYSKNEHVVLILKDDEAESHSGLHQRRSVRKTSSSMEVSNVAWTCDDLRVVTIQTIPILPTNVLSSNISVNNKTKFESTRMKVWDSFTGDLLRIIYDFGEQQPSKLIATHPSDPSIVVTCGQDGYVRVWDIEYESLVTSSRVFEPEGSTPAVFEDVSFSPDGSSLAVTDKLGRLLVFSLAIMESDRLSFGHQQYQHPYSDQYFSTDYHEFSLDVNGYAVDTNTQLPLHEAPKGSLVRIDGTAYEVQPSSNFPGPKTIEVNELSESLENRANKSTEVRKLMDKTYSSFQKNRLKSRQMKYFNWIFDPKKSDHIYRYAATTKSPSKSPSKSPHSQLPTGLLLQTVTQYLSSDDSSDESDYRGSNANNQRRSTRVFQRLRTNETDENETRESRAQRRAARFESHRSRFVVDDTDSGDDTSSSDLESIHSKGRRKKKNSDDDTEDENDHEARRQRRKKSTRRGYNQKKGSQSILLDIGSPVTSKRKSNNQKSFELGWNVLSNGKRTTAFQTDVDRVWLQDDSTHTSQYAPQVGDNVVYLPQGHVEMLREFPERTTPPWVSFQQRWPVVQCVIKEISYDFPTLAEYKRCSSVLAKVTLSITGIPSHRKLSTNSGEFYVEFVPPRVTRHNTNINQLTFEITLRNFNLPDFLVPLHIFNRCIRMPFHQGVRISVTYREPQDKDNIPNQVDTSKVLSPESISGNSLHEQSLYAMQDKTYFARIVGIKESSTEWTDSPWEALQIRFESSSSSSSSSSSMQDQEDLPIDCIGLWEAVPIVDTSSYDRILARNPSPTLSDDFIDKVDRNIEELLNNNEEMFSPFEFEVDSSVFPEYYSVVAVPMYIDLIRRRLKNKYYRQIDALEFDINEIYNNCVHFNDEGADIVSHAKRLVDYLLQIVHDEPISDIKSDEATTNALVVESSPILRIKKRKHNHTSDDMNDSEAWNLPSHDTSNDTITNPHEDVIDAGNQFMLRINNRQSRNNLQKSFASDVPVTSTNRDSLQRLSKQRMSSDSRSIDSESKDLRHSISESTRVTRRMTESQSEDIRKSTRSSRQSNVNYINDDIVEDSNARVRRRSQMKSLTYVDESSDDEDEESLSYRRKTRGKKVSYVDPEEEEEEVIDSKKVIGKSSRRNFNVEDSDSETEKKSHRKSKIDTSLAIDIYNDNMIHHQSRRQDPELKRQLLKLLLAMEDGDTTGLFSYPITDDDAPGYSMIISKPMDLSMIRQKFTDRQYQSIEDIIEDIELMLSNCELYNEPKSDIVKDAKRLGKLLATTIKTLSQIN